MGRRSDIDWERVERLYVAGQLTIRQIADECGVHTSSIVAKAKERGWCRGERAEPARARNVSRNGATVPLASKSTKQDGYIYVCFVEADGERMFKIGLAKDPMKRCQTHQISSPLELKIACCYYNPSVRAEELYLHDMFDERRIRGEWFVLSDSDLAQIAMRSMLV